jgi:phosphatidyl-myo-inositol alpha-mannosyltransferase
MSRPPSEEGLPTNTPVSDGPGQWANDGVTPSDERPGGLVENERVARPAERPDRLLRVGMVSPYSLSVPGGVQQQTMGLARALRRLGVEVRVLAPCDGPPPATFVTPLGDSLPAAFNGSIAPVAPDPSAQLRTIRALSDEEFDVLHLHEPFIPGPCQTAVLLHTAPIIGTFHMAAGTSAAYQYLRRPVLAASHRLAHRVAVSKDAESLVQHYIGGEYEILFNGVELDLYRTGRVEKSAGPTIFFLGRHEERKGLDVLLAAMEHLPAEVTLWVAGVGPDTDRLRAQYRADRRILWLGRLSDADKAIRLRSATVFCAPSLHGESFGVVLIEAMAAGTAVVASSLDGYRNVATDGIDSVLVEPGDARGLAAALRRVLDDADLRARIIARGTPRADEFSMDRLAQLYLERYRQIAPDRDDRRRLLEDAKRRRGVRRMLAALGPGRG